MRLGKMIFVVVMIAILSACGSDSSNSNDSENSGGTTSDGLVAHYNFEGNVNDSSGNGNDGTEHGGVTYVEGIIGKAVSFDGIDDYVNFSKANYTVENQNNFTISYFIKSDNPTFNTSYLSKRAICNHRDSFDMRGNEGKYSIQFENTNLNASYGSIGFNVNLNNWTLVTVTKEGTHYSIYKNSILQESTLFQVGTFLEGNLNFSNSVCIDIDGTERFIGQLDDLRIYNRALNQVEIQELYNLGR